MHNPELSLVGKLDNGLSKWTVRLLGAVAQIIIWLSGLTLLLSLPRQILEYSEGLADLSGVEWFFIGLMPFLIRRHYRYCRHFATGFWRGSGRLLTAQGLLQLLILTALGGWLALYGLSWSLDPTDNNLSEQLHALILNAPLLDVAFYALVLLTTYLAAPYSPRTVAEKIEEPATLDPQTEPLSPASSSEITQ